MKNKVLALSAAILFAGGLAYGFSQSNNEACCKMEASASCCPAPDQCPIPCCKADEASCK